MKKDVPHQTAIQWNRPPWNWLISLHIGIFLLALLILASIIGTLINPLEKAQEIVYYSWWFKTLLLLLIVNISAATVHRAYYRILPASRARFHESKQFYQTSKPAKAVPFIGAMESVEAAFQNHGYQVSVNPNGFGCARKGLLGHWGAPISHAGIVLTLLAGFAASWTAQEGWFAVAEGQTADTMVLRTNPPKDKPLGFTVRCEDFETGFFPRTRIPSSYISTVTILDKDVPVKTDRVEVNHTVKTHGWTLHQTSYEQIPGFERYRLAITKKGQQKPAVVELSPGQERPVPGQSGITIALDEASPNSWRINQQGKLAEKGEVEGSGDLAGLHFRIEQFEPDLIIGPDRKATSRSNELNNPALKVGLYDGSKQISYQWLFGREDLRSSSHMDSDAPYQFDFMHVHGEGANRKFHIKVSSKDRMSEPKEFTIGLGERVPLSGNPAEKQEAAAPAKKTNVPSNSQWAVQLVETVPMQRTILTVTRNPMIPIIYFGCTIMVLGLLVSFFSRRRTIFFWLDSGNRTLHVVGIYRHHQDELDAGTSRVLDQLSSQPAAKQS